MLTIGSDKLKKRGIPVGTALALWWGFNLGALIVRRSENHGERLAMMIMALAFSNIWREFLQDTSPHAAPDIFFPLRSTQQFMAGNQRSFSGRP